MSNFLLPSLPSIHNKFNLKRNISKKINHLSKRTKDNYFLSENNYTKTQENNLSKNNISSKSINYNRYFNGNSRNINNNQLKVNLSSKEYIDNNNNIYINKSKIYKNNNLTKSLNSLIKNTSNKKFNSTIDRDNSYKNQYNIRNKNFTILNYMNDYNIKENNNKYLTSEIYDYNESLNNDDDKKRLSHSIEVNKIIDSLINKVYHKEKSKYKKIQIKKSNFPKDRSIDPVNYIKYNLQKNPYDKKLYKGISRVMDIIGKNSTVTEYDNNMIKKASDINYLKIESDHMDAPFSEEKKYKKNYEDMMGHSRNFKSFNFNKNINLKKYNNKRYSPYHKILDKNYKEYFNKKFGFMNERLNDNNIIEQNKTKADKFFKKNIEKYISFDKRLNEIVLISKNTENNASKKSKEHEKMLNRITSVINNFLKQK